MSFSPVSGFDLMFNLMPVIVGFGFILVFGIIITTLIRGGIEWSKNNNSPILDVNAKVVSKRASTSIHTHHHGDNTAMNHTTTSTTYFVTFEVESGDRMELRLPSKEYGLIAEGDIGKLTFQGTRYKGFMRNRGCSS